jgi:hypothetical protein
MDDLLSEFLTETTESLDVVDMELVKFKPVTDARGLYALQQAAAAVAPAIPASTAVPAASAAAAKPAVSGLVTTPAKPAIPDVTGLGSKVANPATPATPAGTALGATAAKPATSALAGVSATPVADATKLG